VIVNLLRDNEVIGTFTWDGRKIIISKDFDSATMNVLKMGVWDTRVYSDGMWKGRRLRFEDGKDFIAALPHVFKSGQTLMATYYLPSLTEEEKEEYLNSMSRKMPKVTLEQHKKWMAEEDARRRQRK
jgi:hypothetical protein